MFNCSARVWSSATDFCFSSAISTGGTPGADGLATTRAGTGTMNVQDPARLDCVCGGPGRGPELARRCGDGEFPSGHEATESRQSERPSQEGTGKAPQIGRPLYCACSRARQCFL